MIRRSKPLTLPKSFLAIWDLLKHALKRGALPVDRFDSADFVWYSQLADFIEVNPEKNSDKLRVWKGFGLLGVLGEIQRSGRN